MSVQHVSTWLQLLQNEGAYTLTSPPVTSLRLSSTLTLLLRRTHPGFISGCATYTLKLQQVARLCFSISSEKLSSRQPGALVTCLCRLTAASLTG